MNTAVSARLRQPLGLVQIIDRNPLAVKEHPDTVFRRDPTGVLSASDQLTGEEIKGGVISLYTRVWMGLSPPSGREPGYCAVIGEVYEAHLPRTVRFRARMRPLVLLDESSDMLMPRLFRQAADLKDLYMPYVDRADLAENLRRTDADFRLIVWPEPELLEDIGKQHYGLLGYPDEDDLPDEECQERWPYFQSRAHVPGLDMPPYKNDPDRLHGIMDAIMASQTDGQEMWTVHACCEIWEHSQHQTPHLTTGMVVAAMQRWDWSERVDPLLADDDYPLPLEEEDEEDRRQAETEAENEEVDWYRAADAQGMALIQAHGLPAYRDWLAGKIDLPGEPWVP